MTLPFLPELLQHLPVPTAALDSEGRVVHINERFADAFGGALDDMRGRPLPEFIDPADREAARTALTALTSGERESCHGTWRYLAQHGNVRTVDCSISPARNEPGGRVMYVAVLHDVTAHARVADELAHRSAQLDAVIRSVPAGVYIGDDQGISTVNRLAVEQLGFENEDALLHPIPTLSERLQNRDAATGERITPSAEPFARGMRGEHVDTEVVSRHLQSGEEVVQRVITRPVRIDDRIVGAVAVNIDVTRDRRTEEALRMSEARYRALVEQAPLSIQILSPDGRTLQVNSAFERLWGATLEQLRDYNMLEDRQLEARGLCLSSAAHSAASQGSCLHRSTTRSRRCRTSPRAPIPGGGFEPSCIR